MGLSIQTFALAEYIESEGEAEGEFYLEEVFEPLYQTLAKYGITSYREPLEFCDYILKRNRFDDFGYRELHYLRRIYAHVIVDLELPPPVLDYRNDIDFKFIEQVSSPKHHILYHADNTGFYVPVEFDDVIEDPEIGGGQIGSSFRLMKELLNMAEDLDINADDGDVSDDEIERIEKEIENRNYYANELMMWLELYESARISIACGTAITFG